MARVAIRTTASREKGLGHVERSYALGQALAREGHRVRYFVETGGLAEKRLAARGAEVVPIDPGEDESERILSEGPGIVVFDVGSTEHGRIVPYKEAGTFVVTFDDLGDGRYLADLVVDANLTEATNPRKIVTSTRFLLGPEHAVLRSEVVRRIPHKRRHKGRLERLLVTFGGTDPEGLTVRTVRSLERLPERIEVVVAVGPGVSKNRAKALDAALLASGRDFEVAVDPDLPAKMREADLGIVSAGITLYEAAALGLPTIAIAANKGELPNLNQFERAGATRALGLAAHGPDAEILPSVLALEDPDARRALSDAGMRLVDGRGLERVVAGIEEMVAG